MIAVEDAAGVTVVRFQHGPGNTFDVEMCRAITDTMRDRADDPAVVLTGSGGSFSAGVDLRRILDGGAPYIAEFLAALSEALLAVFDCPRPVVAAINGHAVAGGCVVAAACDHVVMSAGTIGLTELLVGVPFPAAALEIVRYAAGPATSSLVTTGALLSPRDAMARGLVDEVVEPDVLLDRAVTHAGTLARIPRQTFQLTKEQLRRPARRAIGETGPIDDPRVTAIWQSPETLTAIAAFLDGLARRRAGVS